MPSVLIEVKKEYNEKIEKAIMNAVQAALISRFLDNTL